jgi:hypothetical protein
MYDTQSKMTKSKQNFVAVIVVQSAKGGIKRQKKK